MNTLFEMFKNYKTIPVLLILLILIVSIALLKKTLRKKQKNRELSQAAEDKLRDENLNNVILNNHAGATRLREVQTPYDVDYSNSIGENNKNLYDAGKKEACHIMLQLVERTELSTRKFMLNPIKKIRIGSDLQNNDITVLSKGVSPHQCEIFSVNNKVYIRSVTHENQTIVKRKKERAIIDEKGVRLLSDDTIILGNVTYDVTIRG